MNPNFKKHLLKITGAKNCSKTEIIQSLWSGYGEISRFQLASDTQYSVVIKSIVLKESYEHPRGWNTSKSHERKVKSYQVETNWYENWSQKCSEHCQIPSLETSFYEGDKRWIVMEDLNKYFPVRKDAANIQELKVCLKWLANFHACFMGDSPDGLWEIGTYWHLSTRPDEFEKIVNAELKLKAHKIDEVLNACAYKTILHGDAKLANFCFSKDGEKVAAVDFQYVGAGCGMKDVAYLLGSCLANDELELYDNTLLQYYFDELSLAVKREGKLLDFDSLKNEWMQSYPYACADFTRFLLGWMPKHQKVNAYSLKQLQIVLDEL